MGKCVVHMQKCKSGSVGGIQSHVNREHESKTNLDIDKNKTSENWHIWKCDNWNSLIKHNIKVNAPKTKTVRKDAVVLCSFIITSDEKSMKAMSEEKQMQFFKDSEEFFSRRYGSENIISAVIHKDETTPHMHLGVVPILDGKLCAKDMFNAKELKSLQTDFARFVGAKYGLERGVENSQNKHLSEVRYKTQKAEEKLAELEKDINAARGQINGLEEQKKALYGEISKALDTLEVIDSAIKEKNEQGKAKFGSGWIEMIRKGNAEEKKNKNDLRLIEFAKEIINEYPSIRDLWHRRELEKARKKSRPLTKEEVAIE